MQKNHIYAFICSTLLILSHWSQGPLFVFHFQQLVYNMSQWIFLNLSHLECLILLDGKVVSFIMFRKHVAIISSNIPSGPFSPFLLRSRYAYLGMHNHIAHILKRPASLPHSFFFPSLRWDHPNWSIFKIYWFFIPPEWIYYRTPLVYFPFQLFCFPTQRMLLGTFL